MSKFKVGDKVICMDNKGSEGIFTVGKIYTVLKVYTYHNYMDCIRIVCDDGIVHDEYVDRFELDIKGMRKEKLNKIYEKG